MLKVKGDIAVFIGRFQVDQLHLGQREILNSLYNDYQKTVVLLGISPTLGTRENPLDYHTREAMIKEQYPDCVVLPLFDHSSDVEWSKMLDQSIRHIFPRGDVMLFGGRDSFKPHYHGTFPVTEVETQEPLSGTTIRENIGKRVVADESFRRGVIYSTQNQYPRVFPTVDIAVIQDVTENNDISEQHLLLGRKKGEDGWRLPGGFVDPGETLQQAAGRELAEETGMSGNGKLEFVTSMIIPDWRYESDNIITTLFKTHYMFGSPRAKDDLEEVGWFSASRLKTMHIVKGHQELIKRLNLKVKESDY